MNFKKYILGLLAILFLSVPSFAEKQVFLGEGKVLFSGPEDFVEHVSTGFEIDISTNGVRSLSKCGLSQVGTILTANDIIISENRENATTSEIEWYNQWDRFNFVAGSITGIGAMNVAARSARLTNVLLHEGTFTNHLMSFSLEGNGVWNKIRRLFSGVEVNGVGNLDDLVSWASKNGLSNLTQAEIKGTFDLFEGNVSFAQKALLSSREIVAGKTLPELALHFNLPIIPSAQSLTPYQARVWYAWRKSQISILVNRSNGLEAAAREALEMRNTIRTTTRNSMKDTDIANFLNTKEVNMTWEEAMSKYNGNYEEIIQASMRGRGVVDVLFKIPK